MKEESRETPKKAVNPALEEAAAERKRDMEEAKLAKERVLRQIEQDRAERAQKFQAQKLQEKEEKERSSQAAREAKEAAEVEKNLPLVGRFLEARVMFSSLLN